MSTEHGLQSRPDGEEFLQQLEAMRTEVNHSMLAIAGNSLQTFEQSLWRQEVLCVSLNRLLQSFDQHTVEPSTMTHIQSATSALRKLNQSYATLVEQSKTSADTLYRLCRDYQSANVSAMDAAALSSCSLEA